MKRIQLQPWTTYEKLCLASAIQKTGDQNWTAVSRVAKNIFEDSTRTMIQDRRPPEWFSMKQCAAQYEFLLKNVVGPRRKKRTDKGPDLTDTPADIIINVLRQEYVEELKQILAEEQTMYLKIKKENEDIEAGLMDDKLEEIIAKIEAKEREKDIRIKLKFKLGEKHLENDICNRSTDIETPIPPLLETEVKPSSATSPLLTSLLQSPSPLTRPSVPNSISLLLNPTPTTPTNESPTLSKLLETPTTISTGPVPQITESPVIVVEPPSKTSPVTIKTDEEVKTDEEINNLVHEEEKPSIKENIPEHTVDDMVDGVVESEVVIENEPVEEKRKPVSRKLDLEIEDVEPDDEVMSTVEQIIEKVEEAIIETVGETTDGDLCDITLNRTIESENLEDHLDSLDLDHEAVELIVMGPNQGSVIAVHHNETSSDIQNDSSKSTEEKEPNPEKSLEIKKEQLEETLEEKKTEAQNLEIIEETKDKEAVKEVELEKEAIKEIEFEKEANQTDRDTRIVELSISKNDIKDVIEDHVVHSEVVVEEIVEAVKPDSDGFQEWIKKEDGVEETNKDSKDNEQNNEETIMQNEIVEEARRTEPLTVKVEVEAPKTVEGNEKEEISCVEKVEQKKDKKASEKEAEQKAEDKVPEKQVETVQIIKEELDAEVSQKEEKNTTTPVKEKITEKTIPVEQPVITTPQPQVVPQTPEKVTPTVKIEPPPEKEVEKEPEVDRKKVGRKRTAIGAQLDSKPNSPASSLTEEDKDYKSWKKSILLVYNRLAAHKYASVFLKPITEAEAAGYHSIIRRPMDLTTIKRNIESGMIRSTVEFQRDMLLMVQNAIMYNKTNTLVYKMANDMLTDMLAQMEVMVQAIGDGVPLSRESYERLPTRGRASKAVIEDTLKRKRNSMGDDLRGSAKRKKADMSM